MKSIRAIASLLFLLAALLVPATGNAQGTTYPLVHTSVDPTSGTIGDRLRLKISATAPDLTGLEVLPLDIQETTWTISKNADVSDSPPASGAATRNYTYTIIPFATGRLTVPQVAVTYIAADKITSNTVLSQPLWIEIDSVLPTDTTDLNLKDALPPAPLPVPPAAIWTFITIIGAIAILLAWLLWRRYSKHLKRMLGPLRPDEAALKEITKIEDERLIEQKKIKEFYTRLTDSLRHYLHEAYGVNASDLTSTELLRALDELAPSVSLGQSQNYKMALARLTELLGEADLVKFAQFMPEASQCRRSIQASRDVIGLTKYRFVTQEEAAASAANASPNPLPPPSPPAPPPVPPSDYPGGQQ